MLQYKSNNTESFAGSLHTPTKLWLDSEISGKFTAPHLSFSNEERFKWSSIYWPQSSERSFAFKQKNQSQINNAAKKVSRMIDDQQKNEARIQKIKQSLSITKSHLGSGRKQSFNLFSTKNSFRLSKMNQIIVTRLAGNETKMQSTLRDRNGNRCNLYDGLYQFSRRQDDKLMNMSKTTGFSTSRKLNLDLPQNYFPGPGTYEIKRYLSQLDRKSKSFIVAQQIAKTDRPSSLIHK